MKSFDLRYSLLSKGKRSYFYGANSCRGFVITPDKTLSEESCYKKIMIKGGPGTGKSTVMKRFSDVASTLGYDVTEYYCSSDPDSLDCVRAEKNDRRIVCCDATSPHISDPAFPGAISYVVDFSPYWRKKSIDASREEIISLTSLKRRCFDTAYSYLRASHEVRAVADEITNEACDHEKLENFCARTASKLKPDGGAAVYTFESALSMKGAFFLDTHYDSSEIYCLDDVIGISGFVLRCLASALSRRGVGCEIALCPYDSESVESIYIPSVNRLYTVIGDKENSKRVNCARFVTEKAKKYRTRFRFIKKCELSFIEGALSALSSAAVPHFALEKIYSSAMNFKSVEKVTRERIISVL